MQRPNAVLPASRASNVLHVPARLLASAVVAVVAMWCAADVVAIAPQSTGRSLSDATAAYTAKDYRRAATLARIVGDRASGAEREGARYLEGLALFQAGELDAASTALRTASLSSDRFIAAQAHVTLASVEVERKRWDAAGYAFRRAAPLLTGAEATRAHSYAARCFHAAGLTVLANESRAAAGEPRIDALPAQVAPIAAAAPNREPANDSVESASSPRQTVTADDRPVPVNRLGVKPSARPAAPAGSPLQFAVQVGAFTSPERASQVAADLRARCMALDIECPRIVPREDANGAMLHVVQFGCFPNRGAANKILLQFPKSGYRVEQYCAAELDAPSGGGASASTKAPTKASATSAGAK